MNPKDFIYKAVRQGCLKSGCNEVLSREAATSALRQYQMNKFINPSKLVDQSIIEAKKLIIKKGRK